MEEELYTINTEDLNELNVDELIDIKLSLKEMLLKIDELIDECDEVIGGE